MSIDLEERLHRAAELLDQATGRDLPLTAPGRSSPAREHSNVFVRVAAALIAVGGIAGLAWAVSVGSGDSSRVEDRSHATDVVTSNASPPTSTPPTDRVSGGEATVVAPAATLPTSDDVSPVVPPTVVADHPVDWYRLQPDLDVAWYSDGAGTSSMLCFRTPGVEQCLLDEFAPTDFGGGPLSVQGTDDQYLIVTLDPVDSVIVTLNDGTTVTAATELEHGTGWRVARIAAGPERWPDDMTMYFGVPNVTQTPPASDSVRSGE